MVTRITEARAVCTCTIISWIGILCLYACRGCRALGRIPALRLEAHTRARKTAQYLEQVKQAGCRVWHPRDHASFTLERPASGPLAAGAGATVCPGDLHFLASRAVSLEVPGSHALLLIPMHSTCTVY